jgi:hypothetical protein
MFSLFPNDRLCDFFNLSLWIVSGTIPVLSLITSWQRNCRFLA